MSDATERRLAAKREHYRKNRRRILAGMKEHYLDNKEAVADRTRAYRQRNVDVIRKRKAEYRQRNKERIAEKKRRYYLDNREKILGAHKESAAIAEYMRWYRKEKKVQMAKQAKEYRIANADLLKEKRRLAQPRMRSRKAFAQNRRKARKAGNGGSHTFEQWIALCERHSFRCVYCGEERSLTEDHVLPLIRGGNDDIENIAPSCGPCNSSKGTKTAEEYITWRRVLELA